MYIQNDIILMFLKYKKVKIKEFLTYYMMLDMLCILKDKSLKFQV